MHLVHRLLPVPGFHLCLCDVSHGGVETGLLGQLVTVHEARPGCVEQAAEGGLLQKVEAWVWLDRDPSRSGGGLEIPERGCRFARVVVAVVSPERHPRARGKNKQKKTCAKK